MRFQYVCGQNVVSDLTAQHCKWGVEIANTYLSLFNGLYREPMK